MEVPNLVQVQNFLVALFRPIIQEAINESMQDIDKKTPPQQAAQWFDFNKVVKYDPEKRSTKYRESLQRKSENIHRKTDEFIFYEFFLTHITSVYDFEKQTGISRADGCRYKAKFEKLGLLQIVHLGVCPISGEKNVQMITTNNQWFKKFVEQQTNLFSQ
ncbi:hypothetical protein [Emticicia oligotrophica]|uniref:hypothetical protein n=1 Tax=Emticicia oligotrophica TaxID=312279 RepID=UPI00273ACED2|nr:hypothetical protein [Emticicia oligotrophica]